MTKPTTAPLRSLRQSVGHAVTVSRSGVAARTRARSLSTSWGRGRLPVELGEQLGPAGHGADDAFAAGADLGPELVDIAPQRAEEPRRLHRSRGAADLALRRAARAIARSSPDSHTRSTCRRRFAGSPRPSSRALPARATPELRGPAAAARRTAGTRHRRTARAPCATGSPAPGAQARRRTGTHCARGPEAPRRAGGRARRRRSESAWC